ncbi:MAG: glycerophosphodiester phosphodiesterase [Bacillus sp. (in: firmicutes)]
MAAITVSIIALLAVLIYIIAKQKAQTTASLKPLIIAHRGAAGNYPENTHAAFRAALDLTVDMIEYDIQLTKDEKFAVIHDETLDRTTDGTGLVRERTMEELQQLDAGSWKDPAFEGERIPELSDMFACYNGQVHMLIEVKHIKEPGKVAALLASFLQDEAIDREKVIIQSFNQDFIKAFHAYLPDIAVGILLKHQLHGIGPARVKELAACASYINPKITNASAQLLTTIHHYQTKCFIWTVRTPQQMKKALAVRPDGIITDYPEWFI